MKQITFSDFLKTIPQDKKTEKDINIKKEEPGPIPEFRNILSENSKEVKDELNINAEWKDNLLKWFSYIRMNVSSPISNIRDNLQDIQAGLMPQTSQVLDFSSTEKGLEYFASLASNDVNFSKSDLTWIFGFLCPLDRLLQTSSNVVENLRMILKQINSQILLSRKQNPYDELLPYLIVDSVLIQNFFHLS